MKNSTFFKTQLADELQPNACLAGVCSVRLMPVAGSALYT